MSDTQWTARASLAMPVSSSWTAGASFISPVIPTDPAFLDLMAHLGDFQEMQQSVSSAASYGHKTTSRTVIANTIPNTRCRLRSLTEQEIEDEGHTGEVISDWVLYVPAGMLPVKLRDPKNCVIFQVVNIRTLGGDLIEQGPCNIKSCRLMAGENHHYQLRLRKGR